MTTVLATTAVIGWYAGCFNYNLFSRFRRDEQDLKVAIQFFDALTARSFLSFPSLFRPCINALFAEMASCLEQIER